MKIRLTIMTENDKHLPDNVSTDDVTPKITEAWANMLNVLGSVNNDRAYVESVEFVER